MLAKVKIEQDKENKCVHKIFVDGKQIKRITRLDFEINPCEVPVLTIETMGGVDFEGAAEVNFLNDLFTVPNACKILREELMKHEDLYDGFISCIRSALDEVPIGKWYSTKVISERILERIIEEE